MQDFLKFWGLRKPLFKEADLVHGIFIPQGFNRAHQRITLATETDNPFICVTSPSGHGKTTLARWLTQRLPPLHFECLTLTLMMPEERSGWLLRRVAELFNPDTGEDYLATLAKGLDELGEEKRRILIVIDNAHHLMGDSFNDIHSLLALQGSGAASVGVVLLGAEELLKRVLSSGTLRNRLALKAKMDPLSPAETKEYLRTVLRQGGLPDDVITEDAMEMIARSSGGIYSVINALADSAFMEAFLGGKKTVNREAVQAAHDFMPQNEKTNMGKLPVPDATLTEASPPALSSVPKPPKASRRTVEDELRASNSDEEASIKLSSLFYKNKAK